MNQLSKQAQLRKRELWFAYIYILLIFVILPTQLISPSPNFSDPLDRILRVAVIPCTASRAACGFKKQARKQAQ